MVTSKKRPSVESSLLRRSQKRRTSQNHEKASKPTRGSPTFSAPIFALLTRILFLLHTVIAIWRVSEHYEANILFFLIIGIVLLMMETGYTVGIRRGKEYKWVSPSVFFYLLSVVPCLWLLEINKLHQYSISLESAGGCNKTVLQPLNTSESSRNIDKDANFTRSRREILPLLFKSNAVKNIEPKLRHKRESANRNESEENSAVISNFSSTIEKQTSLFAYEENRPQTETYVNGYVHDTTSATKQLKEDPNNSDSSFYNFAKSVTDLGNNALHEVGEFLTGFDPQTWLLSLHQVLLFVLVIGRWLLPKGEITRDQLSQLLLVFIGVGADILEFVTETIDEDVYEVRCNKKLHFVIYFVWSWSLIQFTLVLTASKSQKTRLGFSDTDEKVTILPGKNHCCTGSIFNQADLWGILATLLLQDMPFLAFRLYIMIVYKQIHQMMVFFTGKNILVVCLQIYRIVVLKIEQESSKDNALDESELQSLTGTLRRIVKQKGSTSDNVIEKASIKQKNDGSLTVRINLSDESKV